MQRTERISAGLDTRAIDLELFELGYRPTAVITDQHTLENGMLYVQFATYLPIAEDKITRVTDRLTATYPFLVNMHINPENQSVSVQLVSTATLSDLDQIVNHFGYEGHE